MDRDATSLVRKVRAPPDISLAQRVTRRFHSLGYYLVGVCRVLRYICGARCVWLRLREPSSRRGRVLPIVASCLPTTMSSTGTGKRSLATPMTEGLNDREGGGCWGSLNSAKL